MGQNSGGKGLQISTKWCMLTVAQFQQWSIRLHKAVEQKLHDTESSGEHLWNLLGMNDIPMREVRLAVSTGQKASFTEAERE